MQIPLLKLKTLFPNSLVGECYSFAPEPFEYAGITTELRERMFWAQVAHECEGFTDFDEDLYYKAPRLCEVWPTRFRMPVGGTFPHIKIFSRDNKRNPYYYQKNPQRLANYVYANRLGNGNEESNEGWIYAGKGPKMITGKYNYTLLTKAIGAKLGVDFVKHPDLLLEPKYGMWAAAWFWKHNALNHEADKGYAGVKPATRIINGGYIGLDKRTEHYKRLA